MAGPVGPCTIIVPEYWVDRFIQDVNCNRALHKEHQALWYVLEGAPPYAGKPVVPDEWKDRLRFDEIRGVVLEVLPAGLLRVAAGTRDGVMKGLDMFIRGEKWPVFLKVTSVTETECTLVVSEDSQGRGVKPGDTVSSWAFDPQEEAGGESK